MRKPRIEYGRLVENALRGVVRDVLSRLERGEAPEPHHFYITFKTNHPRVALPPYLVERYPSEMTIVLQHQYWDLEVGEEGFSITLSFNDKPERLYVPFQALKVFADPGVEFGLQFTLDDDDDDLDEEGGEAETIALPRPDGEQAAEKSDAPQDGGAEIVTLDRFRKKS